MNLTVLLQVCSVAVCPVVLCLYIFPPADKSFFILQMPLKQLGVEVSRLLFYVIVNCVLLHKKPRRTL